MDLGTNEDMTLVPPAEEITDPGEVGPPRKRRGKGDYIPTDGEEERPSIKGNLGIKELQKIFEDRYHRSRKIQMELVQFGVPSPKPPPAPELLADADGEVIPPINITHLTSDHLGEYSAYYTAMLEWVGRLVWIADLDWQGAASVQKEVEDFFSLEPDVQQYGHRDEREAKRNQRKTVYYAQRITEEREMRFKALTREYERYTRLSFMISREISRREQRKSDNL